jgi:hypothetical protein
MPKRKKNHTPVSSQTEGIAIDNKKIHLNNPFSRLLKEKKYAKIVQYSIYSC